MKTTKSTDLLGQVKPTKQQHAKAKYEQEEKEQLECQLRNDINELARLADKLGYDLVKREG